jgi:hypothetical protein
MKLDGKPMDERPFCSSVINDKGACRFGARCKLDERCPQLACKKAKHPGSSCPNFNRRKAEDAEDARRARCGLPKRRR